jgi:hypothetical protein
MARKAIVDREAVLQLLREGKTSKFIGEQFGVSRQAIDLYRKQFVNSGILGENRAARPIISSESRDTITSHNTPEPLPLPESMRTQYPAKSSQPPVLSLDELVDLVIQAFTALKRVKELEAEISSLRKNYDALLQQVEQLQEHEQKRKEQEARWIHAQSPGIVSES